MFAALRSSEKLKKIINNSSIIKTGRTSMKLISEFVEDTNVITEKKEGGGENLYIEGIFLQSAIKNRNGRMYPENVMDNEVARYVKETIDAGVAYGELNHPSGPQINGDRISHRIVSLKKEGTNYVGKAIIGETVMGNNVRGILKMGGKLGVSSRGLGTLKINKQGVNEVQGDFRLVTAADVVTDPSAPDAWVNGIMESVEYWFDPKLGKAVEIAEKAKTHIKKLSLTQIQEQKFKLFEQFIAKIAKIS